MIPHLEYVDGELDKSYLLQFFPTNAEYQRIYRQLKHPSEDTIRDILAEKEVATAAARQSLEDLHAIRAGLPAGEYAKLERGLRTSENAARLWREIAAVYFRLRGGDKGKLEPAIRSLVAESCRIEKENGNVWPVYPAARGTTAYEFAREAMERGKICRIGVSCQ